MTKLLFRFVSIASGILFFGLLAWRPALLHGHDAIRWALLAGLLVVLFVTRSGLAILRSLPEELDVVPLDTPVTPAFSGPDFELHRLGFVPDGAPLQVRNLNDATVLSYSHPRHAVRAGLYLLSDGRTPLTWDLCSALTDDSGSLTTVTQRTAATLPSGERRFKQVIEGSTTGELLEQHLTGIAWLEARGFVFKTPSMENMLAEAGELRRHFLRAPWRRTITAVFRTLTSTTPHLGPLATQVAAAKQLEAGRRGA